MALSVSFCLFVIKEFASSLRSMKVLANSLGRSHCCTAMKTNTPMIMANTKSCLFVVICAWDQSFFPHQTSCRLYVYFRVLLSSVESILDTSSVASILTYTTHFALFAYASCMTKHDAMLLKFHWSFTYVTNYMKWKPRVM